VQLTFPQIPYTKLCIVRGICSLQRAGLTRQAWLCGGGQLYEQLLSDCSELYLSIINREVHGDTFFPPFEHLFDLSGEVAEFADFKVLRYVRKELLSERGDKVQATPSTQAGSEGLVAEPAPLLVR
jgi:hypothetical protein